MITANMMMHESEAEMISTLLDKEVPPLTDTDVDDICKSKGIPSDGISPGRKEELRMILQTANVVAQGSKDQFEGIAERVEDLPRLLLNSFVSRIKTEIQCTRPAGYLMSQEELNKLLVEKMNYHRSTVVVKNFVGFRKKCAKDWLDKWLNFVDTTPHSPDAQRLHEARTKRDITEKAARYNNFSNEACKDINKMLEADWAMEEASKYEPFDFTLDDDGIIQIPERRSSANNSGHAATYVAPDNAMNAAVKKESKKRSNPDGNSDEKNEKKRTRSKRDG